MEHEVLLLCREFFGAGVPAAAVMGNIAVETGYTFDYQVRQRGGTAKGLFQFEPPMWVAYTKFLTENKLTDSARSQVSYAHSEVMHGLHIGAGNARKIRDAFGSGDVVKATETFCNLFERPGTPHLEKRIEAAKKYT